MSNYELMKQQMAAQFLTYDQEEMIHRFSLDHDQGYLYIDFVARRYRINRRTGLVEWSDDDFNAIHEAGHNEAMTLYDMLCFSSPFSALSGEFISLQGLSSIQGSSGAPGRGLFDTVARSFDHQCERLAQACARLGGTPSLKGDVSYEIPLFSFFPMVFQFWESDEEFPAMITVLFDRNALQFLHYETLWFAASHLVSRLQEEMEQ